MHYNSQSCDDYNKGFRVEFSSENAEIHFHLCQKGKAIQRPRQGSVLWDFFPIIIANYVTQISALLLVVCRYTSPTKERNRKSLTKSAASLLMAYHRTTNTNSQSKRSLSASHLNPRLGLDVGEATLAVFLCL